MGASFRESALIMRSLGAIDAVNLDGGGSTTLSIHQHHLTLMESNKLVTRLTSSLEVERLRRVTPKTNWSHSS